MSTKEGRPPTFTGDPIQRMVTYVRRSIKEKIDLAARLQKRKTGRIIEDQFAGDVLSTYSAVKSKPPEEERDTDLW